MRITVLVDDADKFVARAVESGAKLLMPVQDMFCGGRYGQISDPFGHEWGVNQQKEEQTEAETQDKADAYFKDKRKP